MRGGTVQITWHENKPVLTLDFHRLTGLLATGGADFDIKLWSLHPCENKKDTVKAVYESSLAYHNSAVNVIRFAPSGEQLASGADGGDLLIWKRYKTESGASWKVLKTLSFHRKDVLDLQWSPDGAFLITGSVDNSCIIWDAAKGTVHQILDSHAHYVQGVTWDPAGQYVASLSSDRTCKIYSNRPRKAKGRGQEKINYVCQHVISKAELQKHEKDQSSKFNLFHDETLPSFFRRLEWSPDGSFLVVPAGILKFSPDSSVSNTAHIFSRKDFSRPALQLPGSSKPVVAVRFCPVLFKLNAIDSDGPFRLPYRIVFALATLNSLYIYDTESNSPIGIYAGLHYAAITDIAWSFDAKYLAVSSQDCYCTIVEFEDGDLGCPASSVDIPSQIASNMVQPIIDITPLQAEIMDIDTPETGTNEIVSGSLNSSMDIENQIAEAKQSEPKKLNDTVKLADESQSKQLECSTAEEKPELRYVCMNKQEECAVEKEKHEYHMQIDTNESLITRQEHTSASVQQTDDIKRDQTPSNVRTEKPSKKRITPIAL